MKSMFVVKLLVHLLVVGASIQQSAALYGNFIGTTCEDYNKLGLPSGVYVLDTATEQFSAYCDFSTPGSPWMVIQRRTGPLLEFYRNWTEYENGFADLNGDCWLGNSKIAGMMVNNNKARLRIELTDWNNQTCYAQYELFRIGDASQSYKLEVLSGYSGTCGDSLSYHLGMKFTTYDRDNDLHPNVNCAASHHGAYWYNACLQSNINGPYVVGGGPVGIAQGISWLTGRGHTYSYQKSVMKIQQNPAGQGK